MSATLDVAAFSGFFDDAAVVRVPGGPIPSASSGGGVGDYAEAAVACCLQLHGDPACGGDVLVFMPGEQEIRELVHILDDALRGAAPSLVVPLYGALPREDQLRAFAPAPGRRKFVVATTIAETSVTIGGVRHVVDPGLVKARATSTAGFESLKLAPTSKAQARQRAGRAGREAPGRCYRLYPEASWAALADGVAPEILRCDLASVVLQLKALGVDRPETFDYVSRPPRAALLRALETLHAVGALDDAGTLTARGARLAKLPLAPVLAKALDGAAEDDRYAPGADAVLTIVAVVAASDHGVFARVRSRRPRRHPRGAADVPGDLLTARNAYDASPFGKMHVSFKYLVSL
ncbi:helicase [Aureococcus anophagefferens]|nr:helicase [Aureococcus anophagefferens]